MSSADPKPQLTAVDFDPFAGPQLLATAPSSESQREIWTAVRMGRDASLAFNESNSLRLRGTLDLEALRSAFQDLVARHEALRTTFSSDGLTLCIAGSASLDLPLVDLSGLDERAQKTRLGNLLAQEVEEPFALEQGPLFRGRVIRLAPLEHVLVMTAHHIVCDGWSAAVMIADLSALYRARKSGSTAQLPAAYPFSHYARDLEAQAATPEQAESERYWLKQFSGEIPILELPLDKPRPPAKTYASIREDHLVPAGLVERLKKVGAKSGSSFFTTLLAAFDALLFRLSGQTDLVVGIPAAGQSVVGQKHLVGHCVNTLPLRAQMAGNQPFIELLRGVRKTTLDAYDHQGYTFGSLLKKLPLRRDPSRLPLVSVLFNLDQALGADALKWEGLEVTFASNPRHFENFDLFVNAVETREGVVLECQFNSDLIALETMQRWLSCFDVLLESIAQNPEAELGALKMLPEAQLRALLAWNNTQAEYPSSFRAHQLFEEQARRTPEAVAIHFGETSIGYRELDARANQLAHALKRLGVGPDVRVGLCLERGIEMVVGLFGVLKAGGAYVPLDPAFPKDRLAFMVADSRMPVLVTQASLRSLLPDHGAQAVDIQSIGNESAEPFACPATPDHCAYVIYTSGSTGKPKGVEVRHQGVVNFLCAMAKAPGLTAEDVLLAVTTLSFDIAVLELYLPLSVGGRVVLASRDEVTDGAKLKSLIERRGVTAMQATPSTWRLLLEAGWEGGSPFKALCGGEALPAELVRALATRASGVFNMYGPTETTVWSTFHAFPQPPGPILIGRPIANTSVYVLDERMQPVPVGVPGELHIGGDGVARGYLNRPELTQERFVKDPFSDRPGARLYKTGDLVRTLADGSLEYLRRNDSQVKVRGYRIELGEIEAALATHPAVAQAAAAVREVRPGDVRLVAYLVCRKGQSATEENLRGHLRESLPEYMVPQHFVLLEAMPLTPNNKVDRKALPAPKLGQADGEDHVPPRTEVERMLAALFQEALGIPRVSVGDNFFTLGGHSLLGAQLLSRLNKNHQVALSLRDLFEAPTVESLAQRASRQSSNGKPAVPARIPRRAEAGPAPQSLMQQRLYFLDQVDPGESVYNLPAAFRLRGQLNVSALQKSFDELIRRHESIRATLSWKDDQPVQVVAPSLELPLVPVDLSGLQSAQRERALMERLKRAANEPFELSKGPLMRAELFKLAPEEHVLFFMPHHAIWDGWSFDIFLRELDALYGAFSRGQSSPLPELPIRYSDFAAWHHRWLSGTELERQLAYWRAQLSGELAPLEMPTDRPRPAAITYAGGFEALNLSAAEVKALTQVGRQAGATLYMVLLAAFEVLLHRYTGQKDILVGTPVRGRSQPETEDLIGFFVNTLVLRSQLEPNASFTQLLQQVRATCLEAFAHPDMPFERLIQELNVKRDMSRTPIFQAFFSFQDATARNQSIGGVPYTQIHVLPEAAATDLSLWVMEREDGVVGGLVYASDLFDASTIQRFLQQYRVLLADIVRSPETTLGALHLLPESEKRQLLSWNDTAAEYPRQLLAHQLIEAQVQKAPDAVALVFGDRSLTYRELDARANQLAQKLRASGVGPDVLVGLCLERSLEMVVGILGVLKAGGAYVPLDPAFPKDRLAFMVADSQMPVLVTQASLRDLLPASKAQAVDIHQLGNESPSPLPCPASPQSIAYVIYTSGSTGRPKGVQVPHGAVVNFVCSMAQMPGLTSEDVLLAVTTLSFDIAVLELYLPLAVGGRVVIASRDEASDGSALAQLISRHQVTAMQATPSTWRLLLEAGFTARRPFKVLCGGEALPPDLVDQLSARSSGFFNLYGPTETTVWSTCHAFPNPPGPVRIGRPIANTQVYILDERMQPVPIGVPGELHIGGDGVTRGYWNRPELTQERFVPDPFAQKPGARLYKTGDLARYLLDGSLEYLRRNDYQVKVRGYRIELGEIESALSGHPAVAQAVAAVREARPGDVRLVGYLVAKKGESFTDTELRRHLRQTLPEYMVPQHFVELDGFPLTPNNKVDRKALPNPQLASAQEEEYAPPQTDEERLLANLWQEALGLPRVSVHENFFNLGGHSLLALKVLLQVEKHTGVHLSPRVLLLNSLSQMASQLSAAKPSAPPSGASDRAAGESLPLAQRMLKKLKKTLAGPD